MDRIQKILLSKFNNDQLGHFYLITPSEIDYSSALENWILEIFQNTTTKEIINHPDLLFIQSNEDKKQYKWEDLSEIFNFLKYGSIEWGQKIIIIQDAHKISEIVSNKLLKVLEEPPTPCTFFILNPTTKKLLETIESRAIEVRVKISSKNKENYCNIKEYKSMNLQEFITKLKSSPETEELILKTMQDHFGHNLKINEQLIQLSKIAKDDRTYHNAPNYRLFKLFNALQEASLH